MLHPAAEWEAIAAERHSRKTVFVRFVAPLLCLIAMATVGGTWLSASREYYSAAYVLCAIAVQWSTLIAGLFFSTFLIAEIMAQQLEAKDRAGSFALMAYASCAACFAIAVVSLFPFFIELLALALYSCYLYWRGIPFLMRIDGQKQLTFGLLSLVIALPTYSLMYFLFGKIFAAIFNVPNS